VIKSGVVLQTVLFLSSSNSVYAFGPAGSSPVHGGAGGASWANAHSAAFGSAWSDAAGRSAVPVLQPHSNVYNGQNNAATSAATSGFSASQHAAFGLAAARGANVPVPSSYTTNFLQHLALPAAAIHHNMAGSQRLAGLSLNLDLASSSAEVVLGANLFKNAPTATIDVGGVSQSFRAGQKVTAAEYLAIKETLAGSGQTLTLNSAGAATGGEFSLNQVGPHVGLLVVPAGVTGIDNVSSSRTLSVAGDIVNYGSIYALSTNERSTAATIFGKDIVNQSGGVISSVLPSSLLAAVGGAISGLDLNLVASNNLSNAGAISSSGNLSLVALQGAVTNTGSSTAVGNVNLYAGSGNFVNSGFISAAHGNINFVNPALAHDMSVVGVGGVFQALNGDINLRDVDYDGANNLTLDGGDYLSHNLNLYSGDGAILGSLGKVTGTVNSSAEATHLTADTSNLLLGNNCAAGDPTYASTGNITITGALTAGEAITILAGGNITAQAGSDAYISTKGVLFQKSSDITLVAGGKVTTTTGTQSSSISGSGGGIGTGTATVDFTPGAGTGGNIDLSGSTHKGVIIDASNGIASGSGGNVLLAAVANGATGGQIIIPAGAGTSIDTSSQVGNGGNVTILAGAVPAASATTVNIGGKIQTSGGGTFQSGNLLIATVNPTASAGSTVTYDPNGGLTSGSANIVAGKNYAANAQVKTADLVTAAGGGLATQDGGKAGNITVLAGGGITTGDIVAYGGGGGGGNLVGVAIGGVGGDGGKVTLAGDNSNNPSASIAVNGGINTSGGGGGGSLLAAGSGGGKGGNVVLTASGPVSVANAVYTGDGGDGGSSSDQTTGGGGGGSFGGGGGGAGAGGLGGLGIGVAAGSGGAGLLGGGGGGVGLLAALGGSGGGIFLGGLGGTGDIVGGVLGLVGLGGVGAHTLDAVIGKVADALGVGGGGGSNAISIGLPGLNVPGLVLPGQGATPATSLQNGDVTVVGNGINLGGPTFGRDVSISAPVGSNGAVHLTQDVTGSKSISLAAHGTGDISAVGGQLFTPNLTLSTDNADIGSVANPIMTNADKITASAGGAASNAYINDSGATALVGKNGAGGTFQLSAGGDLTADPGATLKANSLDLTSTNGDIGPMTVTAPNLKANATGDVDITDDYVGAVSLGASTAGSKSGTFSLDASGATGLTTTGDVSAHTVNLKTDQPGAGIDVDSKLTGTNNGTVNLTADGDIKDGNASGLVTAGTLNVTSGSGDVGKSATPFQTDADNIAANAGGDVYLANKGATNLLDSSAGSGKTFSLSTSPDANGDGGITISGDVKSLSGPPIGTIALNSSESGKGTGGIQEGSGALGTLTADNVHLSDGNGNGSGDLGAASSPLLTDTGNLSAQTKGAVYVDNSAMTGNLNLDDLSGSSISVKAGGPITTTKDITTPGALDLTTNKLTNPDNLTGGTVHIQGLPGQDLDIENSGTINATKGDIVVDSAMDKNLLIGSGGGPTGSFNVVDPNNIVLNANGSGPGSSNKIDFTSDQNFNTGKLGQTVMNANSGPNQAVQVEDKTTVVGNNTVVVNSSQLIEIGSGQLIGNPLIFNGGQLGGTIANSSGDVNLGSDFIFNGKSLAIIASGNINATKTMTINLTGTSAGLSNGNGGNLNILAGFDFTPLTGAGQVGPNTTPYIVTGASMSGGNINFGNVTMKVGSTVQDAQGGSVLAVASGSGANAGHITLGSIDTSSNGLGSTKSVGGSVTVIGQNITLSDINTTGVTAGNVSVTAAPPVITGTIHVTNGNISAKDGSFGVGASSTFSGNIVVSGINAGKSSVSISTGNAGSITGTSAGHIIVAKNLTLLAGGGGIGTQAAPIMTNVNNLNANATGGVYVSDSGSNLTLTGTNSGTTFSLVNTNQSTITLVNPINTSNLSIVDKGGTIALPTNTLAVSPVAGSGNGGSILLDANTITWPGSASGPLVLNAKAANTGSFQNGGSITVLTNTPTTETVGSGAGNFQFLASGAGNAGAAVFGNSGGDVVVDLANGMQVAGGANANGPTIGLIGQHITNASGTVLVIDVSGKGTGNGGSVSVNQLSNAAVRVGTAKSDNFQLIARGVNGGSISVLTGGALTLDLSGATYAPTGANGNGGNLLIKAASLVGTTAGPLILDASGVGTGSGGSVSVELTTKAASATVGLLAGNYELSAQSGKKGGNAGSVTFINAGDLTVDPKALKIAALGKDGNGGSITLEAGRNNSGNLFVSKALAANGKGKGNGGNINLTTSSGNFVVGTSSGTVVSGVKGTLTVSGKIKGNVNLTNVNGDLTLSSSLTGVNSATLTAGGPGGSILLASSVGSKDSAFVTLQAAGSITSKTTGNMTSAKVVTLTAGSVAGDTIGTDKTALAVNTQNLTAHAFGLINLADKNTSDIVLKASSGGTFALNASGNLIIGGVINGGTALTLKSSKAITDQQSGNTLVATAVTLTSGTSGMGSTNQNVEVNTSNLVANSGGNSYLKGVGITALNFNGAKNSKLVSLTTAGDLVVNGAIGSMGSVNLATTGSGNILQGNGQGASVNGKFVTLASPGGSVGLALAPVVVKAANLTVNSLSATGGLVNVKNTSTAMSTLNNSFGTSFTYATAGSTKLNNITASAGNIKVTESKGLLQTNTGSQISAVNGAITLQESDAKSGTILLGTTSKLVTSGGAGSNVSVFIGPAAMAGAEPKPDGVTETISSGTINYGVNGVTLAKDALVSITAKGANVVISTGDAKDRAIKINNGVTIIADPPVTGAVIVNPAVISAIAPVTLRPTAVDAEAVNSASLNSNAMQPLTLAASPAVSAGTLNSVTSALTGLNAAMQNVAGRRTADEAWISETELATGEIPALFDSEEDLGITSNVSVVSDLTELTANKGNLYSNVSSNVSGNVSGNVLAGEVSLSVAKGKASGHGQIQKKMSLNKGSVVFSPRVDTLVQTSFGDVSIAAHSLVLVLTFSEGVAVYNLDDSHHGAVRVNVRGREMTLTPGTGAVIAATNKSSFEHINPAQLFGYRNIKNIEIDKELKLFTSEFSLIQAIQTVQPLKQLVLSRESRAQHLASHLLKTAGILMQLSGSGQQYRQVLRPKVVAWSTTVGTDSP